MSVRLLAALLFLAAGNAFAGKWPLEIIDHLDETKIVVYTHESDIEQSPTWKPADGAPPFDLSDLLETVEQWRSRNTVLGDVSIEKIELKPILHHEKQNRWYYLVQLRTAAKKPLSTRYIAVLMSGRVMPAIMEPAPLK